MTRPNASSLNQVLSGLSGFGILRIHNTALTGYAINNQQMHFVKKNAASLNT